MRHLPVGHCVSGVGGGVVGAIEELQRPAGATRPIHTAVRSVTSLSESATRFKTLLTDVTIR